ncbi:MAG: iron-containing alcohol dehydrogenase, partial [Actinomycetota bacterium]
MTGQQIFGLDCTTVVKVGPGSRAQAARTLADLGCQRVALITDGGLVAAGVVDLVREALDAHDVPLAGIFDRVRQDNDTRDINDCAAWCRELGADGLLAVGGGSVLDTAKCVKVMLGMDVGDIKDLVNEAGVIAYARPNAAPLGIPHLSLPTTSGTGAELSQGAALFDEQEHKKILLFHHYMNSDYAFLDPELTVSLPPTVTAETAFDALSHCLEAFFSPRHNSIADAFALRAARLILDNLPTAVHQGDDIEARTEMMTASALAVVASVSGRGAAPIHNFADAVGPAFRV